MFIPYGRQEIIQDDIDAVVEVLQSDFLTQGPVVPHFENMISDYCNAQYGVAVNSATSALHLACLALGLEEGDWLWTSPITFVASANCGLYCGANIDFVDIDPQTYNLSPQVLEAKLIEAKKSGCLPKIVIPVHMCGQSCDMQAIHKLSQQYGFKIIEDASHAIGANYQDKPIGNCLYSDVTVFSFHPVKIITTAEGGMAVTNDSAVSERMRLLRSHGITREPDQMTHASDGAWYYQQIELGYNYRMTELQAALGVSQLERLDAYVARRHQLASKYHKKLRGLPVSTPYQSKDGYSAYHLYVIRLCASKVHQLDHREVFEFLRANGVGINLHYIPVHTQPYYRKLGFSDGDFPQAESYYQEAISLPLYPTMVDEQQDHVVEVLKKALQ